MADSAKFWDKTAERYAKSAVGDEATYQRKLEETQSFFKPDMHVLEFGCGTGTTAIAHAPHVQRIDAIDISEQMLVIARDKAAQAAVVNDQFSRGTLIEYAADAASIDALLGLNVIDLIPNRRETFAEAARILKPGGLFVTSTACLGASYLRFLRLIVPLGKLLGLMPDVYVLSEQELVTEIQEAGFTIERQWHHGKDGIAVFIIARKTT